MSMYPNARVRRPVELEYARDNRAVVNFFNTVYAWMAVGLALTAAIAWFVSQSPQAVAMLHGSRGVFFVVLFAAVGISWYAQAQVGRISANVGTILFLLYAAIMGAL